MEAWGHTKPPPARGEVAGLSHLLCDHLREVARLSGKFAEGFGSFDWAELAGRWHDLGKYRRGFQLYIVCSGEVATIETSHVF
jgi:HD domain